MVNQGLWRISRLLAFHLFSWALQYFWQPASLVDWCLVWKGQVGVILVVNQGLWHEGLWQDSRVSSSHDDSPFLTPVVQLQNLGDDAYWPVSLHPRHRHRQLQPGCRSTLLLPTFHSMGTYDGTFGWCSVFLCNGLLCTGVLTIHKGVQLDVVFIISVANDPKASDVDSTCAILDRHLAGCQQGGLGGVRGWYTYFLNNFRVSGGLLCGSGSGNADSSLCR